MKNILLISQGSTFMVDAISKNLKEAGFNVSGCSPAIKSFKEHSDDADIILFYLGDFLEGITKDLVYLKDVCIEKEKSLNVIGNESELETLYKTIKESVITNAFTRPADIKLVVEKMEEIADEQDERTTRKNILLVDDDPAFLHIAKGWLDEKYKVTIVNSGMQAITYIAKNRPDLIMLDYEMPVTSGPQVLEMIRTEMDTSDIPVIFLTGKRDKDSVAKVLKLKPQGYILKDVGKKELMQQIEDFFIRVKSKK